MRQSDRSGKTVLVLGSGGREHALAWKLGRSSAVARVVVAPGNDAWSSDWQRWPEVDLSRPDSYLTLAARARAEHVDLAVIGPDNPLAEGLADVLVAAGVPTFGPTASAARIEASKIFAKEVMQAARVPTARYFRADSEEEARRILERLAPAEWNAGWVIKCDGLAFGKGVRVCVTPEEAFQAIQDLGELAPFVIEERLSGEELSWMAFCDGKNCALLEPARDHKRLGDRDIGPNTGGMGAFSPVPGIPADLPERMRKEVFLPVLAELARRGAPFRGVLYAGLMFNRETGQFWVLEFNARFGDPEAQVLLARMEEDLFPWCDAVARGDLGALPGKVAFLPDTALIVIGAARGYPEKPERDHRIRISETSPSDEYPDYFWAGARKQGETLVTSGGRVLGALGVGANLRDARERAYAQLQRVNFSGMIFRRDIGGNE